MDIQQAINLGIHERFEQEEIDFAYPTQTVYVHQVGDEQEPLTTAHNQNSCKAGRSGGLAFPDFYIIDPHHFRVK